jgi:acyl-CoA thioester hydrolase
MSLEQVEIRVAFADTDAMGIVHHANYLRYFEVARVGWLRQNGSSYKEWEKRGLHLPLVESQIRYRKPARFDDVVLIKVIPEIEGIRLNFKYEMINKETGLLLATGSTQHVCVNIEMKITAMPDDLLNIITALKK